ncbi:MAG: lipopolysaccharide biosynthesis protein, partial [Proteobacteria bacterium]|nr:lipopolysaccharide biosynthesis protein [Pseudomonadota bacterium]
SAFFWHGGFRISAQLVSWATTIVVIRILSPEDYGLMGMAMILIGFMDIFNDIGLGAAIIQKEESYLGEEEILSAFWMSLLVGAMIYLLIFATSPLLGSFFNEKRLPLITKVLGTGFLIGGLRIVPLNLLTKRLEFKKRGITEFSANLISSSSCILAAWQGLGVWSLVLAYVSKEIVFTLLVFYVNPLRVKFLYSFEKIKNMLAFGSNVTLSRILWYLYSNVDYLVVGKFVGKIPLGYYSVAFQLSSLPISKLNQLIKEVAFSSYSFVQGDKTMIKAYFLKNIRLIAAIIFPVLIGLCLIADDFVMIALGEKWMPASFLLKILSIAGIIKSIASQHAPVLNAIGKPQINVKYAVLMTLIMPITFYYMSRYGIEWVAMCWLIVYPCLTLYIIFKTLRELELTLTEYIKAIIVPLFASLSMCIPIICFQSVVKNIELRMFGAFIIGAVVYSTVSIFFNKETVYEIKSALMLLRN